MNQPTLSRLAAVAAGLALLTSACGEETSAAGSGPTKAANTTPSPALPAEIPTPSPDPTDFVAGISNPFLPLQPGTRWVYESSSPDGDEQIVVEVTDRTRMVAGIEAVVVHDTASTPGGRILEDTFDWYAQDVEGNVWYLGEDTTAYEDGQASKAGSWEAGVDGALAGVAMPAHPQVGDAYAQEFYAGEAEDEGEVVALDSSTSVPYGAFDDLVETEDTTPLEPDLVEHKYYAAGVGVVFEETIRGGEDRVVLIEMTRP